MSSNEAGTSVRTSGVGMSDHAAGQSKFTPDRTEAVLAALRSGKTLVQAAEVAGVYKETLATWRLRHPWFNEAVRDAIARSPQRVSHAVIDACVAAMREGVTGAAAAAALGFTYSGVRRWAVENGRGEEFLAACGDGQDVRSAAAGTREKPRRLTGVERVNAAMTDSVIRAIVARIDGGETADEAVAAELGQRMGRYADWRKAYPERGAPIADAIQRARGAAARKWALELCTPESRRSMDEAIASGCGWNGIAKSVGTYAEKLKGWCSGPFVSDGHRSAAERLIRRMEEERARRTKGAELTQGGLDRRKRDERMRGSYGITLDEAEAMLARQGGGCAICGNVLRPIGEIQDPKGDASAKPCVDHCHDTGRVRGILCGPCNSGIGMLRDNDAILDSAARYLRNEAGTMPGSAREDAQRKSMREAVARAKAAEKRALSSEKRAAKLEARLRKARAALRAETSAAPEGMVPPAVVTFWLSIGRTTLDGWVRAGHVPGALHHGTSWSVPEVWFGEVCSGNVSLPANRSHDIARKA